MAPGRTTPRMGQVVATPERGECDRGRGVAGDHDRLDVARGELVEALGAVAVDLVVGAGTVRRAGVVAEIDARLAGEPPHDLAEDGQPADPGVEESDGSPVTHRRRQVAEVARTGLLADAAASCGEGAINCWTIDVISRLARAFG